MIARLVNVARRLDAMTDPTDGACSVPKAAKDAVQPYVQSWIAPDVEALLAWARGEQTAGETDRWLPTSKAPPKKTHG